MSHVVWVSPDVGKSQVFSGIVESACEEVKSDGIDNVAILSASNPYDASKKAIKMASLVLKESLNRGEEKVARPPGGGRVGVNGLGCILRESESEKDWGEG